MRVWDVSLAKNWKIKERFTAQFRVECFNVINAVNYAGNGGTNPATPLNLRCISGHPRRGEQRPGIRNRRPPQNSARSKLIF